MAEPARRVRSTGEPPVDPTAIARRYRWERARRRARLERRRETKRAGLRFWIVFLVLVGALLGLTTIVLRATHQLFGL